MAEVEQKSEKCINGVDKHDEEADEIENTEARKNARKRRKYKKKKTGEMFCSVLFHRPSTCFIFFTRFFGSLIHC